MSAGVRLSLLIAAALLTAPAAHAQTYTWTGTFNNQWGYLTGPNISNWSQAGLPPSAATVAFVNPTLVQSVNLQANRTVSAATFGGSAPYALTGNTLTLLSGNVTVSGGSGSVEHVIGSGVSLGASGTWAVDTSKLRVTGAISQTAAGYGLTKTGTGTLTLAGANTYTGGTTVSAGTLKVPAGGSLTNSTVSVEAGATLGVTGGSVTAGTSDVIYVDGSATTAATLALSAGSVSSTATIVGLGGLGTFTQTGGAHTISQFLLLGNVGGGTGSYSLGGTGQLSTSSTYVGGSGTGSFTQTGGTHTATGDLQLGQFADGTGTYSLGGSGQLSTAATYVGITGTGSFTQTGGTHTATGDLQLGQFADGTGTYSLGGAGRLSTAATYVGFAGSGSFTQTGGTHTVTNLLSLGQIAGGSGRYDLQDGLLASGSARVGENGTGLFVQTGGVHRTSTLTLGNNPGSTGSYVLRGGTLQANAVFEGAGIGTFAFDGGTLRTAAVTTTLFQGLTAVTIRGGGAGIDTAGFAVTIPQPLLTDPLMGGVPDGGLTKLGAGTLALTGANTYTGGTTVRAGTLSVANEGNLGAAGGPVTVLGSGRLVVTGTGFTTSRGLDLGVSTLAPAAGGTITFNRAAVSGGTLSGGSFNTPAGLGSTFLGVTTAPSAALTLGGADSFTNSTLGGATTVLATTPGPSLYDSTVAASGRVTLNSTGQLSVSGLVSYGQVTLADGTGTTPTTRTTLTNTGTSDLYFGGGSRTVVGTPANAANQYAAVNLGGKQAVVAGGLFVNNGLVGNGTVVADYGATVKGAGTFLTPPVTQNGGRYTPGNSPGRGTTGSALFNGGGIFQFQINNTAGTAGPTPDANNQVSGWSLQLARVLTDPFTGMQTTGGLTVTATPLSKYTLAVQTLANPTPVGSDNFGSAANFDPGQSYSWTFLTYEGPYVGPADLNSVVGVDASQFANSTSGGTFSIVHNQTAHTVSLSFTPVPEPAGVLGLAAVGLVAARRLTRRRGATAV